MASVLTKVPPTSGRGKHGNPVEDGTDLVQSRGAGNSTFERPQGFRTFTNGENSFPTFTWNGGSNIWHPSSKSSFDTSSDGDDQHTNKGIKEMSYQSSPLTTTDGSPTRTSHSSVSSEESRSFQTSTPWKQNSTNHTYSRFPALVTSPVKQRSDKPFGATTTSLSKSGLFLGSNPDIEPFESVGGSHHNHTPSISHLLNPWDNIREFRPAQPGQSNNFPSWGVVEKENRYGRNGFPATDHQATDSLQNGFPSSQRSDMSKPPTVSKINFLPAINNPGQYPVSTNSKFSDVQQHKSPTEQDLLLSASFNRLGIGAEHQGYPENDNYANIYAQTSHRGMHLNNAFNTESGSADRWNNSSAHRTNPVEAQISLPSTRSGYSADRKSTSPLTGEFRSRISTPHFPTSITPPTGPASRHSNSGGTVPFRGLHPHATLLEQRLRSLETQNDGYLLRVPQNSCQPSYPYQYECTPMAVNMKSLAFQEQVALEQQMSKQINQQGGNTQVMRSPLLEDFRVNHKTKRYELKDIFNHIVEFSGDQQGSRFLQTKLETANSDEKEQIFSEISSDSLQLMTDLFGNYVIQKLFEHGNQSQKKMLANQMKGHMCTLSMQPYGCRVVQKALEHILTDQQASLIKELDGVVLKVVENQNGNHVIQKAIERIPGEHIQFIIEAHRGHVYELSKHAYGCRVIQRMLEHCQPHAKRLILDELQQNIGLLIRDSFGNYVVQHVIVNGESHDRRPVIELVQADLIANSKHKFASNVVEKAIDFADDVQRETMLQQLTSGTDQFGHSHVLDLLKDQYGNYVIQKCLSHLQGAALQNLVYQVEQYLTQLRRVSNGKQVTALSDSIREARLRLHASMSDVTALNQHHQWR